MYMDGVTAYGSGNRGDTATFVPPADVEAMEAAVVRAVVRGEQPLAALEETSIHITARRIDRSKHVFGCEYLALNAADLAEGLLNQMHNPAGLADWASFILLAGEQFRLEDRREEACDRLLSAIWQVAFGGLLSAPAIRLAQSLRHCSAKA